MITIVKATPEDFQTIQDIAYKTWPVTYGNILPKLHLEFMLKTFYSIDSLNKNLIDGHHFLLAKENQTTLGFASYIHDYPKNHVTKIPKIYVLPETQGKGLGKILIDRIEAEATAHGAQALTLNVNRKNNARFFYEKLGFAIAAEEDVPLGNGIFQEDYVMKKPLP